jgi:hypothetical protein
MAVLELLLPGLHLRDAPTLHHYLMAKTVVQ